MSHSWAELMCSISHLILKRNCSPCWTVCYYSSNYSSLLLTTKLTFHCPITQLCTVYINIPFVSWWWCDNLVSAIYCWWSSNTLAQFSSNKLTISPLRHIHGFWSIYVIFTQNIQMGDHVSGWYVCKFIDNITGKYPIRQSILISKLFWNS